MLRRRYELCEFTSILILDLTAMASTPTFTSYLNPAAHPSPSATSTLVANGSHAPNPPPADVMHYDLASASESPVQNGLLLVLDSQVLENHSAVERKVRVTVTKAQLVWKADCQRMGVSPGFAAFVPCEISGKFILGKVTFRSFPLPV